MTINWQAVGALGVWTTAIAGFLYWVVRVTIKSALMDAERMWDRKYADGQLTTERFDRVHAQLDRHEKLLTEGFNG